MYDVESLVAAFVIVSSLISVASLGLLRLARLGSPRTRSFVLLVALAMAFSVFWAPFAVTTTSDDPGPSGVAVIVPADGARMSPYVDRGPEASVTNFNADPSATGWDITVSPPARWIGEDRPARTCLTQNAFPPATALVLSGTAPSDLQAATAGGVQVSQGAGVFWALSAVLLCAAAAYLAVQLTFGRRRLMARLGARPCQDTTLLGLVGRTARKMGVRLPRVFICDGPANAFVFGYPAALVISSRLLHRLTEKELGQCIRHELAHIRNGDLLVKPLLQSIRILFLYNPGVHLLVRRMLKERELSADRQFIRSRKDRIDFMSALTRIHAHEPKDARAPWLPDGASALGAHRAGGQLAERYDNLFGKQEAKPLTAVSLCALIFFANLSILGLPAAILHGTGASDAQGETAFFAPMRGHFMSGRAAAAIPTRPVLEDAAGTLPLSKNVTDARDWHSLPINVTAAGMDHAPPNMAGCGWMMKNSRFPAAFNLSEPPRGVAHTSSSTK